MAQLDTVFSLDDRAPLDLVFGDDGGDNPAQHYTLDSAGTVTGLGGRCALHVGHPLRSTGTVTGLGGHCAVAMDYNVTRHTIRTASGDWQQAQPVAAAVLSDAQRSAPIVSGRRSAWLRGLPVGSITAAFFERSQQLQRAAAQYWQRGAPVLAGATSAFQRTIQLTSGAAQRWQRGVPRVSGAQVAFQRTIQLLQGLPTHWQRGAPVVSVSPQPMAPGVHIIRGGPAHWQDAMHPPPGRTVIIVPPKRPCYEPENPIHLVFEADDRAPLNLLFRCDRHDGPGPEPGGTIVVPARRAYIVINEVELRRVDGNIPLIAYSLSLSLDWKSWTWEWSAELHQASEPNIQPAKEGELVEVEARINGVPYRLMIKKVGRSREFPSRRIKVQGGGLGLELSDEDSPILAFANISPRTAMQLIQDVLTFNGVGIGWGVDFGLTDWVVPAGAFVHQGTYASAVNAIVGAAGGYVQPHQTDRTLRILPDYPVAPWDWSGMAPDIDLTMNPVQTDETEWVKKPAYNRVYLSGESQGILARVTRSGTAGDMDAPMVVDPLMTNANVAQQRGRAILSDTGLQRIVTMNLQVLPETGLILPGTFIRRTDGAEVFQGYVRKTGVAWADKAAMRQTIEVQTHV